MSYFVVNEFPAEKVRCKAQPRQLNPDRVRNRSELVGAEAVKIEHDEGGSFLHKKLTSGEVSNVRHGGEATARKYKDSDIFGPPVNNAPRPRRVPGKEIPVIPPIPNTRKSMAQEAMSKGDELVSRMEKETYPLPHKHETPRAHKKVELPTYVGSEVDGFKGMGQRSAPPKPAGLSTKAIVGEVYIQELPERQKQLSPRHKTKAVYNPLNGEKSPHYGQ